MIKVAHVMRSYLAQSETFIWQYLNKFEGIYPVVVAGSLQNLDQFPLSNGRICPTYGPRWTWPWFMDNWYRRVLNRPMGYMEQIIRRGKIQVIHAHFGPVGCHCLPVSLSLNIPLITNFYGYDLSRNEFIDEYRAAYDELFSKGTHFFVEGPHMKEKLISLGCDEKKIFIQKIAIDIGRYNFRESAWGGERPIRLLFVGRFVEKKGLEYALRALSIIKEAYSFRLRIIGHGELEERLQSLSLELGFTKEIEWLGMQSHQRVIEELQSCDILIQPSVTANNGDSEGGAPTIIIEAQACGVPVISTTHADIPYITCRNESALLSAERDVDELVDHIQYLLENPEIWPAMGEKGRKHVEKFHDVKKEVAALENIYGKIILMSNTNS